MVVYSHTTTARLQYVIDFCSLYYGFPIRCTTDQQDYLNTDAARINYSATPLAGNEIQMQPHALLFETGIRPLVLDVFETGSGKAFFKTAGDLDFDLFAAVFFLLSRYEEYLPHKEDMYGRYAHENSIAFREKFLQQPLVDLWLLHFKNQLQRKFPTLQFRERKFLWFPTYDIDIAWSFRNKGTIRNAGGYVRDITTGNWQQAALRMAVLNGTKKDPFDCYDWLQSLHALCNVQALFFFLVAQKKGRLDKNIDPENKALQTLIRQTAQRHNIGLHPSWQSGDESKLLTEEKSLLESIAGKKISASRQHYIRFHLPGTYRQLIAAGITDDYSMGYGSINGFRASVATPYLWYDIEREAATLLRVHPFCFMDANAFYEQKLTPLAAAEELHELLRTVRSVHGSLYTIWHNSFLGTDPAFAGWRNVYADFVKEVFT